MYPPLFPYNCKHQVQENNFLLVNYNIYYWTMDVEHIRETYYAGQNATQEAFEELCAMVENINLSTW